MDDLKVAEYIVKQDRQYLETHEWVQEQDDGTWKVGISHYAQKMLREISYVQFEDTNEEFEKEEVICVVESLKAVGEIYSPFDCELVENNTALIDDPELVSDSPYDEGYLIRIKPTTDDRSSLLSPEDYVSVIEDDLDDL